jgi:hypothetical protein
MLLNLGRKADGGGIWVSGGVALRYRGETNFGGATSRGMGAILRWWLHSWAQRAAFGNFHSFIYYVYRSFSGASGSPDHDGESGGLSG